MIKKTAYRCSIFPCQDGTAIAVPSWHGKYVRGLLLLASLLSPKIGTAAVTSFDDLQFWVGNGANQAALAIDWIGDDNQDTSLAWGYRWDGAATGEQMLLDVLAGDPRLYAKLSTSGTFGRRVYGLGYDLSGDSAFALDDNTTFDADGIAITSASDGVESIDPLDLYREGWSEGFWHYAISSTGPTGWSSSGSGAFGRVLTDGDWDSYAFAVTLNNNEFAENLLAAAPPALAGDFNADGTVDAADYTVWRDGLGTEYPQADYAVWRDNFGNTTSSITFAIPEPATAWLVVGLFGMAWPVTHRRRVSFCFSALILENDL